MSLKKNSHEDHIFKIIWIFRKISRGKKHWWQTMWNLFLTLSFDLRYVYMMVDPCYRCFWCDIYYRLSVGVNNNSVWFLLESKIKIGKNAFFIWFRLIHTFTGIMHTTFNIKRNTRTFQGSFKNRRIYKKKTPRRE